MISIQPLETSVFDLDADTLVYVIRGGWALAYEARMLDDRANEVYVANCTWREADDSDTMFVGPPRIWWSQLSMAYVEATPELDPRNYHACAWLSMPESEFRTQYGLPVDKVQHPR